MYLDSTAEHSGGKDDETKDSGADDNDQFDRKDDLQQLLTSPGTVEDFSVIKMALKSFVKEPFFTEEIQKHVESVNRIVVEAYHLLNLHVLRLLEQQEVHLPPFDQPFLLKFLKCVSSTSNKGGLCSVKDQKIELTFADLYLPLFGEKKKERRRLPREFESGILQEMATEMTIAINNNIRIHFFKRQFRHLRIFNPSLEPKEIAKLQDAINENMDECETHPKLEESIAYDLEAYPERFLPAMYRMNLLRKKKNQKLFSIIPLRRGFVPSSIRITHTALERIARSLRKKHSEVDQYFTLRGLEGSFLKDTEKEEKKQVVVVQDEKCQSMNTVPVVTTATSTVASAGTTTTTTTTPTKKKRRRRNRELDRQEKDMLWNTLFHIDKAFRTKSQRERYRFAYHIVTDGVSVSVLRELKAAGDKRRKCKDERRAIARSENNPCNPLNKQK